MENTIVVVLGHSPSLDRTGELKLSLDGKMRVIAAGELYKKGLTQRIIVSGGKTSGEELPSQAELMSEYLVRHFSMPKEAIRRENKSIDTVENIREIKKILRKEKCRGRLVIISNQYHAKRLKKLLAISGLYADVMSAEKILLKRSALYESFLKKYLRSCGTRINEIKEVILRGLLIIDPKGNIPRKIAKRTRR